MIDQQYSKVQLWTLVALRVTIGWHFLYEGIAKMLKPGWSAAGYLTESKWIFSGIFHWMAETPEVLNIINIMNIWGLTLIGLGLILGLFTRIAGIAGIGLIMLYYFCNPPFTGLHYAMPSEGNYLIVNKNLVEVAALVALTFLPTGHLIGLDRFIYLWRKKA